MYKIVKKNFEERNRIGELNKTKFSFKTNVEQHLKDEQELQDTSDAMIDVSVWQIADDMKIDGKKHLYIDVPLRYQYTVDELTRIGIQSDESGRGLTLLDVVKHDLNEQFGTGDEIVINADYDNSKIQFEEKEIDLHYDKKE
jgi:hypothetical protein